MTDDHASAAAVEEPDLSQMNNMTDLRPIINLAGTVLITYAAFTISPRFGCFTGGLVLLWTWKQLRT